MRLYVIRHGETYPNLKGIVSGTQECELTLNGINQAKIMGEKLKNISFDLVFSSPLKRALKTAKLITNQKIIIDNRLLERSYGQMEGLNKNLFDYKGYWNFMQNQSEADVEPVWHLIKRVSNFVEDLKKQYPDKNILLVTHSGFIRALHYYLCGIPQDNDLTTLEIANCSLWVYNL